jgi:hypothetical protein
MNNPVPNREFQPGRPDVNASSDPSKTLRRMPWNRCGWIVAGALLRAAIGLSANLVAAASTAAVRTTPDGKFTGEPGTNGGSSKARSHPPKGVHWGRSTAFRNQVSP